VAHWLRASGRFGDCFIGRHIAREAVTSAWPDVFRNHVMCSFVGVARLSRGVNVPADDQKDPFAEESVAASRPCLQLAKVT
jgi:hypothetical protein